jgi:hypothetical protein
VTPLRTIRTLVGIALACAVAAPSASAASGLPQVGSGHRPGPDVLYSKPPRAPQLENAGPWKAEPILISGAAAYRDGEFLYQDFLYDDRGARGSADPNDPHGPGDFLFSPKAGTVTYPTDPVYANNAADLVELRVKPLAGATAFRVTLNTLKDPARTAFTIAIGTSDSARAWPHGAGVSSPAELFLTVHGDQAELLDAAGGAAKTPAPTAAVDTDRRQIEVRIPHAAWDPGTGTHRLAAGVGLWDAGAGAYLTPAAGAASETTPGGGRPAGAALFNVAFRFAEPFPDVSQFGAGITIADAAVGGMADAAWWRERAQADALTLGDVSAFFADVDFGKLATKTTDESQVPKQGPMNRILASRFTFGQGIDYSKGCAALDGSGSIASDCVGRFVGQLQPYAIYVPAKPQPRSGYGLTLLMHSLSANYNQYSDSRNQSQMGERAAGTIVVTPAGRGPDGFYAGIAESDLFEVWADVARRYVLDGTWAAPTGYSMGGFGTYRMLARWPDLFGRGFSVVGIPGTAGDQLESLRNTPVMNWNGALDELVNINSSESMVADLEALGLRFVHDLFPTADHLSLATNDEYGPGADFLGDHRADRSPMHVTYVVDPREDSTGGQVVADHAYWLSDLKVRDEKAAPIGKIDVRSEAFGYGDPPVGDVQQSAGTVEGGSRGPMPYHRRQRDWGDPPATPKADRLVVNATNIGRVTVDAARAKISCAPALDITSDGPLDLRIVCAPKLRAVTAACTRAVTVRLPKLRGRRIVAVAVARGKRTIKRSRGRNLRRVVVRRPTRNGFTLRIRARTNGKKGKARTVTLIRRFRACDWRKS